MVSAQDVADEIAENWPALVYIVLTIGFSVCFFRERRREARLQLQATDRLLDRICGQLDRLEKSLVRSQARSGSLDEFGQPGSVAAAASGASPQAGLRTGSMVRTTNPTVV